MTLTGANVPITQLTSASALRLLRNLLTLPYLAFVPIHPETFNTRRTSEVSTQLIISQIIGGKEFITDNVAPGPRIWTMKGYISGIPYIELSNWFMPSLMIQKLIIDNARTSRKAVPFRTTDGEILNVLIKECSFIEEPDNMNTLKIEVTLQELNVLTVTSSAAAISSTEKGLAKSLPLVGKSLGKALAIGGTALGYVLVVGTLVVTSVINAVAALKAKAIEAEQTILATATDLLSDEQAIKVKSMTTVPMPVPSSADPVENFSYSVVLPIGTIYFTYTYIDSLWHITTKLVNTVSYVLTPNILLNPLATDFSLMYLSEHESVSLDGITSTELVIIIW